jgi:hypothetical protein
MSVARPDIPADAPPAGPWQLVVADGSGNVWTIDGEGTAARATFAPVQPATSSSGVYSGGRAGAGPLTTTTTTTLWSRARGLVADASQQVPARAMGTVRLSLRAEGVDAVVILRAGAADDVVALLRAEGPGGR